MPTTDTTLLLKTIGFTALAGMRSLTPPTLLSYDLAQRLLPPQHDLLEHFRSQKVNLVLATLALGEITADKFYQSPDRIEPPALVVRTLTGGGCGALLWALHKRPAWIGAIIGSSAALLNTFPTFRLRIFVDRYIPLPIAGALEDAFILFIGRKLLDSMDYDE